MLKRDQQLVLPTQARAPGFRVELRGTTCRLVASGSWTVATRRKVVPRSSTRKPGARAWVGRTSCWSRLSMEGLGLARTVRFCVAPAAVRSAYGLSLIHISEPTRPY